MLPRRAFGLLSRRTFNSKAVQLCPVIRACTEISSSRRSMPLLQCQHRQHRHSSSGSPSIPSFVRSGDWICSRCQAHNFGSRMLCFECQSPITDGRIFYTKGSWHCPTCNLGVPRAPPGETITDRRYCGTL